MREFRILCCVLCLIFLSCSQKDNVIIKQEKVISAVDISSFPEIEKYNPKFFDSNNREDKFLDILKNNGVNTIRLRLWVDPKDGNCNLEQISSFSRILKNMGFDLWLSIHYSDSWADPGKQKKPVAWKDLDFKNLKNKMLSYTNNIIKEIDAQYIQIGNEINNGFLFPDGDIYNNKIQFNELLSSAAQLIRNNSPKTKIIIHYAGFKNAEWFFNQIKNVDYDIIGISYYPIWHGKKLSTLSESLTYLSEKFNKKILIAETSYPFTLKWNDWTNNVVGGNENLILPMFPASKIGQQSFIHQIKTIICDQVNNGIGFCYWGGEMIAWKGKNSNSGSSWENQSLFDFDNKVLPVIKEFNID